MVLEALKVEIREGRTNLARLADVYRKLSEEENLRRYLDDPGGCPVQFARLMGQWLTMEGKVRNIGVSRVFSVRSYFFVCCMYSCYN